MKVLGSSLEGGGTIVELSKSESNALRTVQTAMMGAHYTFSYTEPELRDEPMGDMFRMMLKFAEARFQITAFEEIVTSLKEALMGAEGNRDE